MTRIKAAAAYKRIDLESAVASADKHELITLLFKAIVGAWPVLKFTTSTTTEIRLENA